MVYTAHVHNQPPRPQITIADDRGIPAAELSLESDDLTEIEAQLTQHGWHVSAAWTRTPDGYQAPVVTQQHDTSPE